MVRIFSSLKHHPNSHTAQIGYSLRSLHVGHLSLVPQAPRCEVPHDFLSLSPRTDVPLICPQNPRTRSQAHVDGNICHSSQTQTFFAKSAKKFDGLLLFFSVTMFGCKDLFATGSKLYMRGGSFPAPLNLSLSQCHSDMRSKNSLRSPP